jgi:hypothetical protein
MPFIPKGHCEGAESTGLGTMSTQVVTSHYYYSCLCCCQGRNSNCGCIQPGSRLTPVILATQEAEIIKIAVGSQSQANRSQDLISKKQKKKITKKDWL